MTNLDTNNETCVNSLKIFGDFWNLQIIDVLSDGKLRYNEIQRRIDSVTTVTLSNRLKRLEEAKLVERIEISRADVEYELTVLGRKTLPIIVAVNDFAAQAKV